MLFELFTVIIIFNPHNKLMVLPNYSGNTLKEIEACRIILRDDISIT